MERVPGFLKAFVIGSGAILVIGALALAVLIVLRAMGSGETSAPAVPSGTAVDLPLPSGSEIEQVIPNGDRVLVLGRDGEGAQFLLVVDPIAGQRLQLIRFRATPQEP